MFQMANYESISGPIEATDTSEEVATTPALTPEQSAEFTTFYSDNYKDMLGVAYGMQSRDPEAAVQTAFMNAMRHWGSYRDTGSTRTAWVSTMVRRNVISEHRRQTRIAIDPSSEEHSYTQAIDPQGEIEYSDIATNANVSSVFDAIANVLTDKEIKDNWLEIFKLYALSDKTQDEIGEELGINPGTVRSRIFRTRRRLVENALLHDMLQHDPIDA